MTTIIRVLDRIRERKGIIESLSNIGWLGGDRILRMFGGVVVGVAVARYLGPSQFGFLNFALAIYGLFNIISNLGLDSLVIRDIALDESGEPEILGTAFVLKGAASVLTTLAAITVAHLLDPHNRVLLVIVILMSVASISQAFDVIDYLFQAQTKSRYTVVPRNIAFVCASVARLAAVFMHMGLLIFAWISALEVLLAEIGLGISYLCFRRPLPRWNWHVPRAKSQLAESWPLLIASVTIVIYMRTDQILLGKMASMTVVGNYAAAIRLSEIWYAIPIIIGASVMPRLLRTRKQYPARYYARLQRLYESMVLIAVSVAVVMQFAGPFLVRLLYGGAFASAASILSVHIWTGVFVFVGCIGGQQYVHERVTFSSLQRTALGAIVNIALNLLWIPRWGGMGSAMATLVAQGIGSYFGDAFDPSTRHIFSMKTQAYLKFWMLPRLVIQGMAE